MNSITPVHRLRQCLLLCLLLAAALSAHAEWHKTHRDIMGTRVTVDLQAENSGDAKQCSDRVFDEMHRIDRLMSPWREDSELSRINALAAEHAVKVSPELYRLIERSVEVSEASGGAFDITFASIGYLYDYRKHVHPSDETIEKRLDAIDFRHILLDPEQETVRFGHHNVRLDLGGIAKGYAVDNAIRILKQCGIRNAMVSAGGDSRVIGTRDGYPWMIGVRHPRRDDEVVVRIPLTEVAVSTSGDYERFFIEDGTRHHHIIDPETGKSAGKSLSATVIGGDATTTDALSTTLFILGAEKALAFIESWKDADAIIIDNRGKMYYSSGLMPPIAETDAPTP